jgi:PhzF family phenazine biosynthesis protein
LSTDRTAATEIHRYAAFTREPDAGNPAGVVPDARGLSDDDMLQIAAEVGFSETAFLISTGENAYDVRYFAPRAEVPFCGHATIAAGVALVELGQAEQGAELAFSTAAGTVAVSTGADPDGATTAQLTSVPTAQAEVVESDLDEALAALGWAADELDPALPPAVAYAGAYHLVLAAGTRERLARLDYDVDRLRDLMERRAWTTVQLVWRESPDVFQSRNPFPVGGVYEDPATGAAAAALGGYLRDVGLITAPTAITIQQGVDMGRPSRLTVDIPVGRGAGVRVSGNAVRMSGPPA